MKLILAAVLLVLSGNLPAPIKPAVVDYQAVRMADELYPGTAAIVAAIRIHENGRGGHELGHDAGYHRRSSKFALRYRKEWRQYLEAARSVSRFTLEWAALKEPRPDYFRHLADRYYGGDEAGRRAWAKSVGKIAKSEDRMRLWVTKGGKK